MDGADRLGDTADDGALEVPDSLEGQEGIVVLNRRAIGNPDIQPPVWVGASIRRHLNPCSGDVPGRGGYCGGVNGYHADDCPVGVARDVG